MKIKLWIDDIRPAPEGYKWIKSVNEVITYIYAFGTNDIEEINLDHDAGDYAKYGGDYIKILDFLESLNTIIPCVFKFHSMNPVGVKNMRNICIRNGWTMI